MKKIITSSFFFLILMISSVFAQSSGDSGKVLPFSCGSACTNPGFESGTGFWDYWTGTACSAADPCGIVAGFDTTQHFLMSAGGFDSIAGGTALPVVAPGGDGYSLRLGDMYPSFAASRAAITFNVSAVNSCFTYQYAIVWEDAVAGHTPGELAYFRVRVTDSLGNTIPDGNLHIMAAHPMVGFTMVGSTTFYYKGWSSVTVPLDAYIGQCVTFEFTSTDCVQGGHRGYAYIDADCGLGVSLSPYGIVCDNAAPFTLTGGSPTGGTYSGPGVSLGTFDPAVAGVGIHTITYTYTDSSGCYGTDSSTIQVDICTGINAANNPQPIVVYPNPSSSGEINFNFPSYLMKEEISIEIFDARGSVLLSVPGIRINTLKIEMDHFSGGIYFYRVLSPKFPQLMGKFFLQK